MGAGVVAVATVVGAAVVGARAVVGGAGSSADGGGTVVVVGVVGVAVVLGAAVVLGRVKVSGGRVVVVDDGRGVWALADQVPATLSASPSAAAAQAGRRLTTLVRRTDAPPLRGTGG